MSKLTRNCHSRQVKDEDQNTEFTRSRSLSPLLLCSAVDDHWSHDGARLWVLLLAPLRNLLSIIFPSHLTHSLRPSAIASRRSSICASAYSELIAIPENISSRPLQPHSCTTPARSPCLRRDKRCRKRQTHKLPSCPLLQQRLYQSLMPWRIQK